MLLVSKLCVRFWKEESENLLINSNELAKLIDGDGCKYAPV